MRVNPVVPVTKRRFANPWAELDYLCKKIRYWLYIRKNKTYAHRYLDRLEGVLKELPENNEAILREEALALLKELQGKIAEAIAHRKREIKLMTQLHKEASSPTYAASTKAYMLQDRGNFALQERQSILRALKEMEIPGRGKVSEKVQRTMM